MFHENPIFSVSQPKCIASLATGLSPDDPAFIVIDAGGFSYMCGVNMGRARVGRSVGEIDIRQFLPITLHTLRPTVKDDEEYSWPLC